MSVGKVNERIGSSPESFEAAAREMLARARRTLRNITGLEAVEGNARVEGGRDRRVPRHAPRDLHPRGR